MVVLFAVFKLKQSQIFLGTLNVYFNTYQLPKLEKTNNKSKS